MTELAQTVRPSGAPEDPGSAPAPGVFDVRHSCRVETSEDGRTVTPMKVPCVFPVAGVSHHQTDVWICQPGDPILVEADPTNPYDEDAYVILASDRRLLGYLHRANATYVKRTGVARWAGEIDSTPTRNGTRGLRIRITGPADQTDPLTAAPDDPAGCAQGAKSPAGPEVFARSGRRLGTYAGQDGTTVLVLADGATLPARYPAALVRVAAAPAAEHAAAMARFEEVSA